MKTILAITAVASLFALTSCEQTQDKSSGQTKVVRKEHTEIKGISTNYAIVAGKDSVKKAFNAYGDKEKAIIMAVNRTDAANIVSKDTMLVPQDLSGEVNQYAPFPQRLEFLNDVDKIVFFSYPAQYFAAYENGYLVHAGPTNMGREKDKTPTGLFYANWKAEKTTSTFNDEWELKWNFNIENKEGVGWHEYAMPGYPASHSCLRMLESDAKYMYEWADQWELKGTDDIQAKGTPVIVFGSYPFGSSRPWYALAQNAKAMDITVEQLQQIAAPHLADIQKEQQKRVQFLSSAAK